MTEKEIIPIINRGILSAPKYTMNNLKVYLGWESDCLYITQNMIAYEVEIKVSRSDFKRDFKKQKKHFALSRATKMHINNIPNYFYYACPDGLIKKEEVPEYAGLIYVYENTGMSFIKAAPKLHGEKFQPMKYDLLNKFYYNMVSWKDKAIRYQDSDPDKAKKEGYQVGLAVGINKALCKAPILCPNCEMHEDGKTLLCKEKNTIRRICDLDCENGNKLLDIFYGDKKR